MSLDGIDSKIAKLQQIIAGSKKIVGFTGAGISTESGISDYRSKGGIWDKFQPVYFEEFLSDPKKRRLYWERKIDMWPEINNAQPNSGHLFFYNLFTQGKLLGLITQNIDGLHEKSGIPEELIVNIHGTNLKTRCLSCSKVYDSDDIFTAIDLDRKGVPVCEHCGGLLKPDTISFGQSLRQETLVRADEMARRCDCMLCFGSTLVVHPAAGFPERAKADGAQLVILTMSETPLDSIADLVINEKIGAVLDKFAL